jgi:hypothetical protein
MPTPSFGVTRTTLHSENRSWLLSPHGVDINSNLTLDVSLFTAGVHYPNGYIPSGIVLGKVTATGKFGPYDNTATDGRETAAELLFGSMTVTPGDTILAGAGYIHGLVGANKLPIQSGPGSLDAAARAELNMIRFVGV